MRMDKDNAGPTVIDFIYERTAVNFIFLNLSSLSRCCVTLLIYMHDYRLNG